MMKTKNIEYLGKNIDLDGTLIERKMYYHWDPVYSNLIPISIKHVLLPFDYGIRKNGEEISISSFLVNSDYRNIETIFQYINDTMACTNIEKVRSQFLYVLNPIVEAHYNPILSIKYINSSLNRISLYVAPLHDKSLMPDFLTRAMDTFEMLSHNRIRYLIQSMVKTKKADLFMTAWDLGNDVEASYKIYLKIKKLFDVQELFNKDIKVLVPHLSEPNFRFCEIAFSFVNNILNHYNLYYKPQSGDL